jgi:hypothetical protein
MFALILLNFDDFNKSRIETGRLGAAPLPWFLLSGRTGLFTINGAPKATYHSTVTNRTRAGVVAPAVEVIVVHVHLKHHLPTIIFLLTAMDGPSSSGQGII